MDEKLQRILENVLEVDSIDDAASSETVASWDSLRHLQLITAIEEEYGIQFEPEEMMELHTVSAIAAALARRA